MSRSEQIADVLRVEGIMAQGYGMSPKIVMRDRRLTPEAKCIYSYLSAFAGGGNQAFPGRKIMLEELGMSQSRYYRHLQLLLDYNYIRVERTKAEGNLFGKNVYTIVALPDAPKEDIRQEAAEPVVVVATEQTVEPKEQDGARQRRKPAVAKKAGTEPEKAPKPALSELRERLDIDVLSKQCEELLVEEIFLAIEDMVSSEQISIGKTVKSKEAITAILDKLKPDHIRLVVNRLAENKKQLVNRKAYIQTCIMNSIFDIHTLALTKNDKGVGKEEQQRKEKEQKMKAACQNHPELNRIRSEISRVGSEMAKAILSRDELRVKKIRDQLVDLEQQQKGYLEQAGLLDCM